MIYIYEHSKKKFYLGESYGPNTTGQIIINTLQKNIINPNINIKILLLLLLNIIFILIYYNINIIKFNKFGLIQY